MIGIIDFNPKAGTPEDGRQYIRLIGELLPGEKEGIVFRDVRDLSRYDGLVLSGSALSAVSYQRMIRDGRIDDDDYRDIDRVAQQLKEYRGNVFGICFGSQLAALLAGGEVGSLDNMEVGYLPHVLTEAGKRDPVFGHLPERFYGAHLHRDIVNKLPEGGEILATRNGYVHAYRIQRDGKVWYGCQPHPEMSTPENAPNFTWREVRKWLTGAEDVADEFKLNMPQDAEFGLSQTITRFAGQM